MSEKKKNILFLLPDQMRADFLGCYGAEFAKTPTIDRLAREGVCYHNCVTPSPICVPARASLLTGMNAIENGVLNNDVWLRPDHEKCGLHAWPKILTQHGYDTIAVGKMHFYPWDAMEGFSKRIICEDKRHYKDKDDYADFLHFHGLFKYRGIDQKDYQKNGGAFMNPHPKGMQADDWISDRACDYLKNYTGEKPFAMMVGFLSPHDPYDPDKTYYDVLKDAKIPPSIPETKESKAFRSWLISAYKLPWCGLDYRTFTDEQKEMIRKCYAALNYHIDICVKKILTTLEETGHTKDTVIIFSSDHGDFVGDYSLVGKCLSYEPSAHVPLIVKDPSCQTNGSRVESPVSLTDVRATILKIAGLEKRETESSRVLPECEAEADKERVIFSATDSNLSVRYKTWKLTRYNNGSVHLFNLATDPTEQINRATDPLSADQLRDLDVRMQKILLRSVVVANSEKTVDKTKDQTGEDEYFNRLWERPYPVDCGKAFYQ